MTEPSKDRIAAALALAEALCDRVDGVEGAWERADRLLSAYRATAPKLRTRAEVDAEIARVVREKRPRFPWLTQCLADDLQMLIQEPTAETDREPDPEACSCDESLRLRDAVNEAAKLLNAIHEAAKSIVELSRRVP